MLILGGRETPAGRPALTALHKFLCQLQMVARGGSKASLTDPTATGHGDLPIAAALQWVLFGHLFLPIWDDLSQCPNWRR